MRIEIREYTSVASLLLAPAGAMLVSLVICGGLIAVAGAPVLRAYVAMAEGAVGSTYAVTETLVRATPLIFTGLAVSVAFRSNLWNIGAEGQLYAGALAAVLLGRGIIVLPAWLMIPFLLAVGFCAGAVLLLVPTILKIRFGVDEVVTTLLSNFVVLLLVSLLLDGPLKDPSSFGWPQSAPVISSGILPVLVARTRLHLGFIVAMAAAGLVWLLQTRSIWGYEMRATGANFRAAKFAGIPVGRALVRVAVLSGGLAGLAGISQVAGLTGYLSGDLSPGFGYTGIIVATLAQLNPLGVVAAAIFIAGIYVGAGQMSVSMGISNYVADVITSVSLLTMLVAVLIVKYRVRRD